MKQGLFGSEGKRTAAAIFLLKTINAQSILSGQHVCRLEPFTIMDYDYEKNRIELELDFPFSSCCAGTCGEKEILPVEEIGKAAK